MTASLIPVSTGQPMTFTKDEATAAERTWLFYLSNTADGSPATGKAIAGADFKISKDGAVFGNAAGVVTEVSLGWYKMVFAAADLDVLGALACELAVEAGVDPLRVVHQVRALDQNVATVNPATAGIAAGAFATDAVAMLQTPLTTKTTPKVHAGATGDIALSMMDAVDVVITATGTWDGATLQPQVCEDPTAAVPVWSNSGATLVADGSKTIAGPHNSVRAHITGGSVNTALTLKFEQRKPLALG